MTSRIIPGIFLHAFWDLGESGWKAGMDENIWRLSFLVQSRVLGVVETLPPGPEEGDRYILNNDASPYDQHVMVYDQALWVPIVPEDRFVVFNTENDSLMYFNLAGNTWVSLISPEAIKEAYESNPNTNEFTDDEKAKLGDIEDNATADMTAEEIKAAYESNPNSNAFTDAEKAKLSGLSSSRFLGVYPTLGSLQSSHPAPAEGSFGYVDGGPLLDILCYIWDANSVKYVLQASAGGMETPETIKTKYESNEDTNAFTDAEKSKLASIELDLMDGAITNAKMADMATNTFKARNDAGSGPPEDISASDATAMLDPFVGSGASHKKGLVPDPGATAGTTKYLREDGSWQVPPGSGSTVTESIIIAASDETTALTAGANKVTFRMPYPFTLTAVRASLTTAQASGSILTVDINEGGTSILSTKLTIDNTEKTSLTAATAPVISDTSLADDAEIIIDLDQIGDGTAKGLKVYLIGHQ